MFPGIGEVRPPARVRRRAGGRRRRSLQVDTDRNSASSGRPTSTRSRRRLRVTKMPPPCSGRPCCGSLAESSRRCRGTLRRAGAAITNASTAMLVRLLAIGRHVPPSSPLRQTPPETPAANRMLGSSGDSAPRPPMLPGPAIRRPCCYVRASSSYCSIGVAVNEVARGTEEQRDAAAAGDEPGHAAASARARFDRRRRHFPPNVAPSSDDPATQTRRVVSSFEAGPPACHATTTRPRASAAIAPPPSRPVACCRRLRCASNAVRAALSRVYNMGVASEGPRGAARPEPFHVT